MWCAAGYPAETFWHQTERSFYNALAGAAERTITIAWQHEFFARQKKLDALSTYMEPIRPSPSTKGAQALLGALFKMRSKGVQMTIERIPIPERDAA